MNEAEHILPFHAFMDGAYNYQHKYALEGSMFFLWPIVMYH